MNKKQMSPKEAIKDAEKNKISFGKDDQLDSLDLSKKYAKVRITTMIDLLLKEKLKEEAELAGTKYQILLNDIIKQYFDQKSENNLKVWVEEKLSKLERKIDTMERTPKRSRKKESKAG